MAVCCPMKMKGRFFSDSQLVLVTGTVIPCELVMYRLTPSSDLNYRFYVRTSYQFHVLVTALCWQHYWVSCCISLRTAQWSHQQRHKIFNRYPSRGINPQTAWKLLTDKWALVVVPKSLLLSPVPFWRKTAENNSSLSFTGQTFSTSCVQLFTWNVFCYDGIERWILGFILCLCACSLCSIYSNG